MQTNASAAMSQAASGGANMSSNVSQAGTSVVQAGNQMTVTYRYRLTPSPNSKVRDLVLIRFVIDPTTNLIVSKQRVRRTCGAMLIDIISGLIRYATLQAALGTKKFSTTINDLFNFLKRQGLISTQVKYYNFYDVVRFVTRVLPGLKMSPGNPSFATVGGVTCTNVGRFLLHLVYLLVIL
jgi:hypothetical protein